MATWGESRHKSQAKWTPGFTVLVGYVHVQGYRFLLFLSAAVVENTDTVSSIHLPYHAEIKEWKIRHNYNDSLLSDFQVANSG